VNTGIPQSAPHVTAPLPIPFADQHVWHVDHHIIVAIVSVRTTCCMNNASGCGVDPWMCTRREANSITNTV
jgi:hypothetical protein